MRRHQLVFAFFAAVLALMLWWKLGPVMMMAPRMTAEASAAPQKPAVLPIGIGLWREAGRGEVSMADAWETCQTLRENIVDTAPGERLRTRHVRMPGKYPLIRVDERWEVVADGAWRMNGQLAMVADHVVVKAKPGTDEKNLLAALRGLGVELRRKLPASGQFLISWSTVDDLEKLPEMLTKLRALGLVRVAEPDWIVRTSVMPNDTRLAEQWALHNTGQTGGTADADIDAPEAWDLHTGGSMVKIGVIDTGIQYSHPDLAANIWTNPGEIAENGLDDDGNGYVDDVRGWDFANDDNDPADDHNHGTHVAGTIAAATNNSAGVAGVCWQARLVPLKFLNAQGYGANSDATEAIAYATTAGVHLTSNSWGGGGFSQAMLDAITAARDAGILFVAAAGNNGINTDTYAVYPAGYDAENIISVAATDHNDAPAYFSNLGLVSVDLGAPGVNVPSTVINGYAAYSGTSMAAPHVAGVCALLKSAQPGMSMADVKGAVLASADAVAALEGKTAVGGRLNAHSALRLQGGRLLVTPRTDLAGLIEQGEPVSSFTRTYTLKHLGAGTAEWTAVTSVPWITLSATGGSLASAASTTVTAGIAPAASQFAPGIYEGKVTFRLLSTGAEVECPVRLEVTPPPLHQFTLDTDPGWARTGQWAHGAPGGAGGTVMGNADPAAAATGTHVFGVNLAGDHSTTPGGPFFVTSAPLNFTGMQRVRLKFRRWLNTDVEPYAKAVVEVSANGSDWTTVWRNGAGSVTDSTWTTQLIDLSAIADGQAAVQVRWGYEVAAGAQAASGWNLDDVSFYATPARVLSFDPPLVVTEGGAAATVTLRASQVPAADLVVTLSSSSAAQLSLPATVTLLAGAVQTTFSASAVNDALLDGTQAVTISASAAGWSAQPSEMTVQDDETTTIGLMLPSSGIEGGVPAAGLLSLGAVAGAEVRVPLASTHPTRAQVPSFVVIAAGQSSAAFSVYFPDNALLDGDVGAVISAAVSGWTTGMASINVHDNDGSALVLNVPAALAEGQGSAQGTVRINGTLPGDLVVTLASNDTTEITVPASVTIPAGSLSAVFSITIVNDALQDGAQPVLLTASSSGFVSGEAALSVADDEITSFTWDAIPLYQLVSVAFPVRITARDVNGAVAAGFSGIASLSATTGTPSLNQTTTFEAGVWQGWVNFSQVVDTRLVATSGAVSAQSGLIYIRDAGYVTMNAGSSTGGMVYEPVSKKLLVALPTTNQIRVINPSDLSFESFTVNGGPNVLAVSADGTQLYATVSDNTAITRVPLATRVPAQTFSLGTNGSGTTYATSSIAVLPENPFLLAAAISDGVAVYDNGTRRPVLSPAAIGGITTGGAPGRVYGWTTAQFTSGFSVLRVDGDGVREIASFPQGVRTSHLDAVSVAGNRAITSSGVIFDPETGVRLTSTGFNSSLQSYADAVARRFYRLSIQSGSMYITVNTGNRDMTDFADGPSNSVTTFEPNGTFPANFTSVGDRWLAFNSGTKIIFIRSSTVPQAASVDLSVEQAISPSVVQTGQTAHLLLRVKNRGPGTATAAKVTCTLPAGLSFQSGSVASGSVTAAGSAVTATLGDVPAGAIVNVFLRATAAATGTASNTATVSSRAHDIVSANNSSTASCTVQNSPPDALRINLGIQHAVYDPVTQRIYASMSKDSNTRMKNCILPIHPETGELGAPIEIGMNPGVLALTDNSQYLYCVLRDGKAVGRYDVTAGRVGRGFSFSSDTSSNSTPVPFLGTVPGSPEVLLVPQYHLMAYERGVYKNLLPQPVTGVTPSATPGQFYVGVSGYPQSIRTCRIMSSGIEELSSANVSGHTYGMRRSGKLLIPSGGSSVYEIPAMNDRADLIPPGFSGIGEVESDAYDGRFYGYTYSQARAFDGGTLVQTGAVALPAPANVDNNSVFNNNTFFRWGRKGFAACYTGSLSIVNDASIVPEPPVDIVLPAQFVENAGASAGGGRITLRYALATDLVVDLVSSRPALLRPTARVVISAGQTSASFDYEVFDDALVNGARAVTIMPVVSNPALTPRTTSVTITDDENVTLSLSMPASLAEAAGVLADAGTVTLSSPASEPVTITLASSAVEELTVPTTVVVPAGQSSVSFPLTLPDDDWLDGDQSVTLTASVPDWSAASASSTVTDNDPRTLTLVFPNGQAALEGDGLPCRVQLSAKTKQQMIFNPVITPSGIGVYTYGSLSISPGSSDCTFYISRTQDTTPEEDTSVTLQVAHAGFSGASATVELRDDEIASLGWGGLPASVTAGQSFNVSVSARNLSGSVVTNAYPGATFSLEVDAATWPVMPASGTIINGYLDNQPAGVLFTVTKAGAARLKGDLGSGIISYSPVFTVNAASAAGFVFDALPPAPIAAVPFPVTLRARDAYDNIATYSGTAALAALRNVSEVTVGTTFYDGAVPMLNGIKVQRSQAVYPAADINASGQVMRISFHAHAPVPASLQNFKLRLKNSALTSLTPNWDNAGWSVCLNRTVSFPNPGWNTLDFDTPFTLAAGSNLMMDTLFFGAVNTPAYPARFSGYYGSAAYATAASGNPDAWNTLPSRSYSSIIPAIKLGFGTLITSTPASTGSWSTGAWTGSMTVQNAGAGTVLRATSGALTGDSGAFTVHDPAADADSDKLPDWWEITHALTTPLDGAGDDPDSDRRSNLLEYLTGTAPKNAGAAASGLETITSTHLDGDQRRVCAYTYRRRAALSGWTFGFQASTTLGSWTSAGLEVVQQSVTPDMADPLFEIVTALITLPAGWENSAFLRLYITSP